MPDAVRQSLIGARTPRRRSFDERVAVRYPAVMRSSARLLAQLSPASRLRKTMLARVALHALGAYNRRDLDAVVLTYDPDFEYCPGRDWVAAGLADASYRGMSEYRRYVANVDQVWAGQNWLTPREVVDLGDRVLILADGDMRAQGSGVPLRQEFALLCTLERGLIVTAQEYYDHAEALRVVGLA